MNIFLSGSVLWVIFTSVFSHSPDSALCLRHHCHTAGMRQDLIVYANVIAGAIAKGCPFKFMPIKVNMHI